jgi:hypothetical protein
MTKRKKRLERGIVALERQKGIHEEKRRKAKELGNEELMRYYDKELQKFENEQFKKRSKLGK